MLYNQYMIPIGSLDIQLLYDQMSLSRIVLSALLMGHPPTILMTIDHTLLSNTYVLGLVFVCADLHNN